MIKIASIISLLLMSATPALAASSKWFKTDGAKIRLIALPSANGLALQAGLQIELEKGWKTYWRAPGASGLPPQFTFLGSQNVASTSLDFPIPDTFGSAENLTAGYKKSITFPITVEPLFANRKTTIKMQGLLGLCEEICVPVQFQLALDTDGKGFSSGDVAKALFQSHSNLMNQPRQDFKIEKATASNEDVRELKVTARVPVGTKESTLFVEGPSNWYLTPVHAKNIEGEEAHFVMSLADIPKDAKPHETRLKLSLVANGEGIEQDLTPSP